MEYILSIFIAVFGCFWVFRSLKSILLRMEEIDRLEARSNNSDDFPDDTPLALF